MAFIYYLTQVQFDFGAVKLLKQECERVGITRPLVVTDPGVKAAGVLQKALDALTGMPVAVFDQTPSNPTEASVRAAVEVYRANRCDGLIAVGGGSAIDCAKGVAIAATPVGEQWWSSIGIQKWPWTGWSPRGGTMVKQGMTHGVMRQ